MALLAGGCRRQSLSVTDASGPPTDGGAVADILIAFTPGTGGDPAQNGPNALGAADGKFVRLGDQGVLTLGLTEVFIDGDGPDLNVVLAPGGSGDIQVYASQSDEDKSFLFTGTVSQGTTMIDLGTSALTAAIYLRMVSFSPDLAVDAVQILHSP